MTAYDYLQRRLNNEMVEGNRHSCRRDAGRLAGGLQNYMDYTQIQALRDYVVINSNTPEKAEKEWETAVAFGKQQPLSWDTKEKKEKGGAFDWEGRPLTENYKAKNEFVTYLETLYQASDRVAWCAVHRDGKPSVGQWGRTAGELIELVKLHEPLIERAIGLYDNKIGAWIRHNPVNPDTIKKAVCDKDIAKFNYTLIESDKVSIERQREIYKELKLPIAALVNSAGKSLHAIVKIHADSIEEYKKRVSFLHEICNKYDLEIDVQNKNPSRYSRMPGVMRNGKKQTLEAVNIGMPSWEAWKEFVPGINAIPEIIPWEWDQNVEPPLDPALISGLLRQGHKMRFTAASKAGKSFALLQLHVAASTGTSWFNHDVSKCKSMYINLELAPKSCTHRMWHIHKEMGLQPSKGMVDVWHLRGHALAMDVLTKMMLARIKRGKYKLIVLDPVYKVAMGDENNAFHAGKLCNEIDKVCTQLNASFVECHHHSKGEQKEKAAIDRGSGSGLGGRDADVILDIIELPLSDDLRNDIMRRWEVRDMTKVPGCPALSDPDKLMMWAESVSKAKADEMRIVRGAARKAAQLASAWKLEVAGLREFEPLPPRAFLFRYPLHVREDDLLSDTLEASCKSDKKNAEKAVIKKAWQEHKEKSEYKAEKTQLTSLTADVMKAVSASPNKAVHVQHFCDIWHRCRKTVRRHVAEMPEFTVINSYVKHVEKPIEMAPIHVVEEPEFLTKEY